MSDVRVPPESDAALMQMWRQVFQKTRSICQEEIRKVLAANYVGGKLDGSAIGGTVPLAALPVHHVSHETGGSDAIAHLVASVIDTGTLALARGGTGIDSSAVTDGQLLIGQSSDHSLGLATLTAGLNVSITNTGHAITIAASGSGGGVLNTANATLASNVSLASAYTWYDVLSLALTAGTWEIMWGADLRSTYAWGSGAAFGAKLYDGGSTIYDAKEQAGSYNQHLAGNARLVLSGSTTIKLACITNGGTGPPYVEKTTTDFTTGNVSTQINAVQTA